MRKGLLDILKGKFLVSGDAPKNWMFLLFASFLAALMISSSHNADKKVLEIAELNEEVRKLKSEFLFSFCVRFVIPIFAGIYYMRSAMRSFALLALLLTFTSSADGFINPPTFFNGTFMFP